MLFERDVIYLIIDDVVRNPYKRVEEEYFLSGLFWEKPSRDSVASPIFEDAEEVSEHRWKNYKVKIIINSILL